MRLTKLYSRVAVPHGVLCPHAAVGSDGEPEHKIGDALVELFEPADKTLLRVGQSAMLCPNCMEPAIFPKGFISDPVKGKGYPVVYWSKAIWDSYTIDRQNYVRGNQPNVEKFLK